MASAAAGPPLLITTENQNFHRLIHLLVTTGTAILCSVMEQEAMTTHHKTTFQEVLDDPGVKNVLQSLHPSDPKKKKVINASQWNLLYPATGDSDTSKYDISLLIIVIRHFCGFPKTFKWDSLPAAHDTSLQANIARLKHYRNETCMHSSSASIKDADFHKCFDEIKNAILGICIYSKPPQPVSDTDIEKLRTNTTDPNLWNEYVDVARRWTLDDTYTKDLLCSIQSTVERAEKSTKSTETSLKGAVGEIKSGLEALKTEVKQLNETLVTKAEEKERCIKESLEKKLHEFCEMLQDFYTENMSEMEVLDENDKVPMDDIFVPMSWYNQKNPSTRGEKEELKNYWEMFDIPRPFDKKLPRRILIEGTVGMGKSIFSQKICVDWAGDALEPSETLKRFQILLHISLAEVEANVSLEEIIFSQIQVEVEDDTKKVIMTYIQENQSKILLVLDGYDEYSGKNQDINKILSRSLLRNCCVIITSRPWKTVDEKSMKHYDLFLALEGFKHESAIRELTGKFMQLKVEDEDPEEMTDKFMLQLKDQNLMSFVQAPFLLVISCLLFLENQSHIPEKVTEMYQKLMKLLFDRFEKRNKNVQEIDRHEIMLALGKLSYNTLVSDKRLSFHKEEIKEEYGEVLFKSGLLTQHKYKSRRGQYLLSFPHKSFAEYLAAYYLQNNKEEFNRFLEIQLFFLENVAKLENVFRFLCGLLDDNSLQILQHLLQSVKFCEEQHKKKYILFKNELPENMDSFRGISVFKCTHLLQCMNESKTCSWSNNTVNISFLIVNENTFGLIPLDLKLCAETIQISKLEASQLISIFRRLDMSEVDTMILEHLTSMDEFHDFFQDQKETPRVVEIKHSKMAALQNIAYLKSHPKLEEILIIGLEMNENAATPSVETTNSQAPIKKLAITKSSPSVVKYFLDDKLVLQNLVHITTEGQIIMDLLQAQSLKKVKVIDIDNDKIEEPGNHVYFDAFLKLIAINPTIKELMFKHCHVVMSRHSIIGSHGHIEGDTQGQDTQEHQSCQQDEGQIYRAATGIHFDECSFDDESGKGFQAMEIFEKLAILKFCLCSIPPPLLKLLWKSLCTLKYLQTLVFEGRKVLESPFEYLPASMNVTWKYMNNFTALDCLTCKSETEAVMNLVRHMPNLTILRLYNDTEEVISCVEQDTIEPLLLQGLMCARLKHLVLNGMKLKTQMKGLLQSIRSLKNLEKMDLSWNGFDDSDAATLIDFIENNFKGDVPDDKMILPRLVMVNLYAASFSFEKKTQLAKYNKELKSLRLFV